MLSIVKKCNLLVVDDCLRDDQVRLKQLCFQHSNEDMEDVWTPHEDAVKFSSPSDGFGPEYEV